LIANVAGVWVVEITVEVHEPHAMTFPAPVVTESTIANPTMVEVEPVQAAKVMADELKIVHGVAEVGEPQSPEVAIRA
jgi:hypothetical protein